MSGPIEITISEDDQATLEGLSKELLTGMLLAAMIGPYMSAEDLTRAVHQAVNLVEEMQQHLWS